jgi:hypothetical protein
MTTPSSEAMFPPAEPQPGSAGGNAFRNVGHGWVYPRPDGQRARCGGPALCRECNVDNALKTGRDSDLRKSFRASVEEILDRWAESDLPERDLLNELISEIRAVLPKGD